MKKELQVQITTPALDVDKDTTNSYHALINEYWLNEIKSQDDAIRHLINAVVIILGVYFTVILNNLEKIFIFPSVIYDFKYTINGTTHYTYNNINEFSMISTIYTLSILLIPPYNWIYCLRVAMTALCPFDKDIKSITLEENNEQSTQFLIDKTMKKHKIYKKAYRFFFRGIILLVVIIILAVILRIIANKENFQWPPYT